MSELIKHTPNHTVSIFANPESFEVAQRTAKALASSTLIPKEYQNNLPNTLIALELANRLGQSPLTIMQNIHVIEGRPTFSSKYLIAVINSCGRFTHPLDYELKPLGKKVVNYTATEWDNGQRKKVNKSETINDMGCIAYSFDKSGKRLESPVVTIETAVKEGWYGKAGSKWQTMPELMLRYRAASFFNSLYCSDITQGMTSTEEIQDIDYTSVETVTPVNNVIEKLNETVVNTVAETVADTAIIPVVETGEYKPELLEKPKPKDEDLI